MKYTPYKDYLGKPLHFDSQFNSAKASFDNCLFSLLLDNSIETCDKIATK